MGVLVLSPVTATGRLFSRVNRELRLGEHRGNRIFLSPFVMAPSTHAFTSLRNSLCYAPEGFKYQFLNFMSLRVGHSAIDDSWSQEAALIEQFDGRFWRSRRAMLAGQSVGIREGLGASTKSLELAEDFVYWRGYNYKPSNVASGAVYATIAAVLQNQREVDPYSGSDSLRSLVYRHAVLDPVNFEQFNDPLIQICLWRCSESGEMDFRRSDDMSEALLHVIRHSLRDFKDGKQSALLDILIGIAVGRIRVSRECVTAMQGDFTRQPKVAHLARDLLRAIAKLA